MNNKISPLALSFIVLGFVLLLKLVGEVTASYNNIYGNMFLFYGIVSVFINIGKQRKGALFVGVLSFMVGVLSYIFNHYNIISSNQIIFPATFIALGSGFLFLFLDDFSEKLFLYISLILILYGGLSIVLYDSSEFIKFSASTSRTILDHWEYLIIIIGVGILTDRRG